MTLRQPFRANTHKIIKTACNQKNAIPCAALAHELRAGEETSPNEPHLSKNGISTDTTLPTPI